MIALFLATCPTLGPPQIMGSVKDARLKEISSAAVSAKHPGILWVVNDSGNAAELYAIDPQGTLKGIYQVTGAVNYDWEGLGYASGRIYIADTGDNKHVRSEGVVYEVMEPEKIVLDGEVTVLKRTPLVYPKGKEN